MVRAQRQPEKFGSKGHRPLRSKLFSEGCGGRRDVCRGRGRVSGEGVVVTGTQRRLGAWGGRNAVNWSEGGGLGSTGGR